MNFEEGVENTDRIIFYDILDLINILLCKDIITKGHYYLRMLLLKNFVDSRIN